MQLPLCILNLSSIVNGLNAEHTGISGLRIIEIDGVLFLKLSRFVCRSIGISLLLGPVIPHHCTLFVPQSNIRHQNEIILKPIPSKPLNDTITPAD